ncbi:MAG: hypothetical protein AAFV07_08870 [Bacteroidota bacterium]
MEYLVQRLEARLGKEEMHATATWCAADQARFDALVGYMLGADEEIARRAAWVFQHAVEMYPERATPHVGNMVSRLEKPAHNGIQRSIMRSLVHLPIPEASHMPLMERGFALLDDPKVPVAVRVFSMMVLERLVIPYPELCCELSLVIESHMPDGSAGFKSRGRKVLKNLQRRF